MHLCMLIVLLLGAKLCVIIIGNFARKEQMRRAVVTSIATIRSVTDDTDITVIDNFLAQYWIVVSKFGVAVLVQSTLEFFHRRIVATMNFVRFIDSFFQSCKFFLAHAVFFMQGLLFCNKTRHCVIKFIQFLHNCTKRLIEMFGAIS